MIMNKVLTNEIYIYQKTSLYVEHYEHVKYDECFY